jgi:hypothetical protein
MSHWKFCIWQFPTIPAGIIKNQDKTNEKDSKGIGENQLSAYVLQVTARDWLDDTPAT